MVFLGVISGVALAIYRAQREGYSADIIYSLALWMCVAAIAGARLFYVYPKMGAISESYVRRHAESRPQLHPRRTRRLRRLRRRCRCRRHLFRPPQTAGAEIRRHHRPVSRTRPRPGPRRLFPLNGCCYGGLCNQPWAVTFPPGSPVYMHQASLGQIPLDGIHFDADPFAAAVVKSIDDNSIAAQAGLHPGDRIVAIQVEPPAPKSPYVYRPTNPHSSPVAGATEALANIQQPGAKLTFRTLNDAGQTPPLTQPLSRPPT